MNQERLNEIEKSLIQIVERDVVPALGCTEPISLALAAATAAKYLGKTPERIEAKVSPNLMKNGLGVIDEDAICEASDAYLQSFGLTFRKVSYMKDFALKVRNHEIDLDGLYEKSDEEVIEAAKLAHAHHFIKTLADGYNMEINEEADNISQGQKQLLTIARAILSDPKILILDEATSSLDSVNEMKVSNYFEHIGCTRIVIAHRLSTIIDSDVIYVMDKGEIIEQGTHKELMMLNGAYAQLYKAKEERKIS